MVFSLEVGGGTRVSEAGVNVALDMVITVTLDRPEEFFLLHYLGLVHGKKKN